MSGPRTRFVILGVLAIALSACGSDESEDIPEYRAEDGLPDRYGLYAEQEGQLGRIDGDKSFQIETWGARSTLEPDVTFIIFDRVLADRTLPLREAVQLRQVAHVRNEVTAAGLLNPAASNNWVVAALPAFDVRLDFQPVAGRPDMVRAIPTRPLSPGLYSLELRKGGTATAGRFGVQWNEIDKDDYAAAHCVDRYGGERITYRYCDELSQSIASRDPAPAVGGQQTAANSPGPAGEGLQLREVQAVKGTVGGVPTLTVQGVVLNPTTAARSVPPLRATLRDKQGKELKRWTFMAETTQLLPGGSTGFRTDTLLDAATVADVQVTFAPVGSSSQLGGTGL